jgi:hypothetical protein
MARARSLFQFPKTFLDEQNCAEFLFERCWPHAVGARHRFPLRADRLFGHRWAPQLAKGEGYAAQGDAPA